MACSDRLDLPLGARASDVGCDAGEGRIYTWSVEGAIGSGHLVAWVVAVGSVSRELVEGYAFVALSLFLYHCPPQLSRH